MFAFLSTLFRSRATLQLEIVALRHQLTVYQRTDSRPRIQPADRLFWSRLSRWWSSCRSALAFVQPGTVIAWQRKRFRDHWAKLSQRGRPGRPTISKEIRKLIRKISIANPRWGSARIVGELRKLGIDVAKSTVDKYRVRSNPSPSPMWKAFLLISWWCRPEEIQSAVRFGNTRSPPPQGPALQCHGTSDHYALIVFSVIFFAIGVGIVGRMRE